MPVYTTRKGAEAYGYAVGVLLLDYKAPFVPGDVGNATSYDYPVLFRTVPKATVERVFRGDPELDDAVVETARALAAQGVKGISSDCGFFVNYQDVVTRAVDVPVFLSSLLQLPFIGSCLGRKRSIGVITADSRALGNRVLELAGVKLDSNIVVRGLQDEPAFASSVIAGGTHLDTALIQAATVKTASRLAEEHPEMGAIVLECSMLPPYSKAVQDATGLPVFDFLSMIGFFQAATHRPNYSGYY